MACAAIAVACGSARRSEPIAGPVALASDDLRAGRQAFMRHCDSCHVHGEGGLGPSLNDKALPEFAMRLQVREGFGAMPGFSKDEISDDDLDRVIEYLVTLRHARGPSHS